MGDKQSPQEIILRKGTTKVVTLILSTDDTYRSTLDGGKPLEYEDILKRLNSESDAIQSFFEDCGLSSEKSIHIVNASADVTKKISELCGDTKNMDALILCVLGVSEKNEVFSLDKEFHVDMIIQPLIRSDHLCNKLKIFIFQAFHGLEKEVRPQAAAENISVPIDADIFVADASIPFNWKGKTMASILKQIGEDKKMNREIYAIFTKVNEEIENDDFQKEFPEDMETSPENRKHLPVTHFWSTLRDFVSFESYRAI